MTLGQEAPVVVAVSFLSQDRPVRLLKALGLKCLAVVVAIGCTAVPASSRTRPIVPPLAVDRVVVLKAERRLLLMHGESVERWYHVSLGANPVGPKVREGDSRTPEGTYRLEHNPHSDYFLSLKVSYPNEADRQRARAAHVDPGGLIMIHGLPNHLKHEPEYYAKHDWTDGCIAVSDVDMAEIWRLTADGVPIQILAR